MAEVAENNIAAMLFSKFSAISDGLPFARPMTIISSTNSERIEMILIAGSTGALGTEIVSRLHKRGAEVRGLVRSTSAPEKVQHLKDLGAETVIGDLKHRASLDAACRGVKTVISTVSIIGTAQPGDSFQATDSAGTKSLIDAAKAAGANHFIFVSFDADHFPSTPLTDAKKDVENYLRSGVIDYTILQPPPFMDVWLGPMLFGDPFGGEVKIYGAGTGKVPYISRGDVAEVAVNAVFSPSARNQTIKFTGPELISQREVVHQFEEVAGKPVIVTEVPEQVLEIQWKSAQNPFEKTFAGLMLGVAQLNETETRSDQIVPKEMVTVQQFARQRAAGNAGGGGAQAH